MGIGASVLIAVTAWDLNDTCETMKDLDNAFSKTSKIYENFEKIEERFLKHKTQSRIKGGRKESASEKGLI